MLAHGKNLLAANMMETDELIDSYYKLRQSIDEWKKVATPTALDKKFQEEKLAELETQFQTLDKEICKRRGDFIANSATTQSIEGISKQDAIAAFSDLIKISLKNALEDTPKWIQPACLSRGTAGGRFKTIWCPILLATCLYEYRKVPKGKLDRLFANNPLLQNWQNEWEDKSLLLI